MRIRNIAPLDLKDVVEDMEMSLAYPLDRPERFGQWFNARFVPRRDELYKKANGHFRYQRRSASWTNTERRVHALCWHGHLHLFRAIFERFPKAEIHTALAKRIYGNKLAKSCYTSGTFERLFPETGRINIGSAYMPVRADEACFCSETGDDYWKPLKTEALVHDSQSAVAKVKSVRQANLTAECWLVQIWGKGQCERCGVKDTDECGGQNIRKTGKNEKGLEVPIS
jgi:hypothetical protein